MASLGSLIAPVQAAGRSGRGCPGSLLPPAGQAEGLGGRPWCGGAGAGHCLGVLNKAPAHLQVGEEGGVRLEEGLGVKTCGVKVENSAERHEKTPSRDVWARKPGT